MPEMLSNFILQYPFPQDKLCWPIFFLEIDFNFLIDKLSDKTNYSCHLIQRDAITNEIVGGCTFQLEKDLNPLTPLTGGIRVSPNKLLLSRRRGRFLNHKNQMNQRFRHLISPQPYGVPWKGYSKLPLNAPFQGVGG